MLRIQCPNPACGETCQVTETDLGRSSVCRKCGRSFVASAPAETPLDPIVKTAAAFSAPPSVAVSQAPASVVTAAASSDSAGRSRSGADTVAADVRTPSVAPLTKLGRFEIRGAPLGVGAFGTVYRGYDPVLAREVALKVPHAGSLRPDRQKERFLREAKAAAQLRHPNIVPVYEAGVDGNTYYIASALIEGRTLKDAIDNERFDFARSVKIVRDLAGALNYAHRLGVVHRDIKPANIMLDSQGEPLLMDFGLARIRASSALSTDSPLSPVGWAPPTNVDRTFHPAVRGAGREPGKSGDESPHSKVGWAPPPIRPQPM